VHLSASGAIIRARVLFGPRELAEQQKSPNEAQTPGRAPEQPGDEPRLRPEDQARVDAFLKRGVNSVERKPFRPVLLLIMLVVVVATLSLFSQWLARWAGVY
jgi:hypothetical protein